MHQVLNIAPVAINSFLGHSAPYSNRMQSFDEGICCGYKLLQEDCIIIVAELTA